MDEEQNAGDGQVILEQGPELKLNATDVGIEPSTIEPVEKKARRDYKLSWKYICAYAAAFAALTLIYAVIAALGIPTLRELLDAVTGLPFFCIMLSSFGVVYLADLLRRKIKKLPNSDIEEGARNCLRFCVCMLIAFTLECTVFQYNHYGVLGTDGIEVFSTQDGETEWTTQNIKYMTVTTIGEDLTIREQSLYFSDIGLPEDADEVITEDSIPGLISKTDLLVPENSIDEELAEYYEEKEKAQAEAEEKGEEYIDPDPGRILISGGAVVTLANPQHRIASVHIDPLFIGESNRIFVSIVYKDEESSYRETGEFTIIEGLEHTYHIPVYPVGDCSEMHIVFYDSGAGFTSITFNEMIPLTPVLLRILLVAGLLFAVVIMRRYNIFAVKTDFQSRRQNVGFAIMLAAVVAYASFTVLTSHTIEMDADKRASHQNYNKYLVDALLKGQLHLDLPASDEFLNAERQYDWMWLEAHGISQYDDEYNWDTIFYEGKWYAPHPIVPCILLFLPFTAITGLYLPYGYAALFFGLPALVCLLFILRRIVKKFLLEIPYIIYILMSLSLCIATFIPFNMLASFYETVSVAGVMFTIAGFLLLLGATELEKPRYLRLFFACLCFALSVGCRPTMICYSIFVPIFTWKYIKPYFKKGLGEDFVEKPSLPHMLLMVAIPYIIVAAPLMWYNYARFGSVLDFGAAYGIGNTSGLVGHLRNSTNRVYGIMYAIKAFLFNPPSMSAKFPFISAQPVQTESYSFMYNIGALGMIFIPLNWLLLGAFSIRKSINKIESRKIVLPAIAIASVIILFFLGWGYVGGNIRYPVDYAWILAIAAFICTGCVYERFRGSNAAIMLTNSAVSVITATSTFMFMMLSSYTIATRHPQIFGYLARAFDFFGGV